jgi:hypothetical protein
MNRRLRLRRGSLPAFAIFMGLTVISLVIFSPFTFSGLANVRQFYMTISVLISSFALVGIAISLLYQARAGRTSREQAIRSLQQQLIKMEMDDPALMTAMGAPWGLSIPAESARIRDHLYIHMWATFWAGNYAVGELNDATVREEARLELFSSEAGRAYWAAVREKVLTSNEGKYRRFARLVDEEYQKIMASNAPVALPVRITHSASDPPVRHKTGFWHCALVGVALLVGALARRKLSRRPRGGH